MWDEIVSKNSTRPIKETHIHNLAEEIRKLQNKNLIYIELFSDTLEYKEKVKKHIENLKKYSNIHNQNNSNVLLEHFEEIVK